MKKIYLLFLLAFNLSNAFAQKDSIRTIFLDDAAEDAIENVILSTQNDNGFELNTSYEHLETYAKNKINLNKVTKESLSELGLLTPVQIEDFFQYRKKLGELIVLQELQAIPSFDLVTIKRILPFVTVSGNIDDYQISLLKMIQQSDNQLFVRTTTFLEKGKGLENGTYLGNNFQHYVRYKRSFGTKFSMNVTLEKDRGEPYFYDKKIYGADFMSGHISYKTNRLQLIIGDFAANFGQGLVLFQDFAPGKSPFITDLKRQHKVLRPYSSVAENTFLRGVATAFPVTKNIDFSTFASYRNRDALVQTDTLQAFDEIFTSIGNTGLHRSEREIANKNIIQNLTLGASLKLKSEAKHIAFNVLYNQFNKAFQRDSKPYNQFAFRGKSLLNVSADYSYVFRNINLFGETAVSDNGGIGTVNGALIGLDKTLNMSILHRYYARDYQSLLANPVAESLGANNENGLYFGLSVLPTSRWKIESFADIWKNNWLRFQVNSPANGVEFYNRITYTLKRKLEFYVQYRYRLKDKNASNPDAIIAALAQENRQQLRFNLQYQISPEIEWESRIEFSRVAGINPLSQGYLAYQDLKFKPKGFPVSLTARYCIFDTDSYDSRIYTYENSLMYLYSIPPLSGKGSRFYVNLRYVPTKNILIEARVAQTYLPNSDSIGSGQNVINSNSQTEVGLQMRFNF